MTQGVAVTVLIGAPGTNGHQLFNRIVNDDDETRMTAIAPWPRSKATQAQSGLTLMRTTERLKRLGQGCSCCTVRGDVLLKVRQIAEAESADRVLIQVPPQSDLDALAKTFSVADLDGSVLGDVAAVDRVVTVVDGRKVLSTIKSNSVERLMELVRAADTVWIDGAAALESSIRDEVVEVLGSMNPGAQILQGQGGAIKLSQFAVLETPAPSLDPTAVGASMTLPHP